ncbi:MAG: ABC transporter permease [Bacillota bacterium]|nr:ABC transporter permease [Bacillota bacterium]
MNSFTVAKRIVKQIAGDKRTLALLFIAPIAVLYLLSLIINNPSYTPTVAVYNVSSEVVDALKTEAQVYTVNDIDSAKEDVKNRKTDAYIDGTNGLEITVEGTDTSVTASVKKAVSAALADVSKDTLDKLKSKLPGLPETKLSPTFKYIYGSDSLTMFDTFAAIFMGFFIFFFVFLIAGIAFLREKISGTLERLVATPIKRIEIVMGYFLGFGLYVVLQTLVIQVFTINVLGVAMQGNFFLVLLTNLLLAGGSLALGTLLSAFARNEFQIIQFIPIVVVPQILFSGILSLKGLPQPLIILSKLFPLTYAADALTGVVIRGSSFGDIAFDLLILLGFAILFIVLNSLALKRYRKI